MKYNLKYNEIQLKVVSIPEECSQLSDNTDAVCLVSKSLPQNFLTETIQNNTKQNTEIVKIYKKTKQIWVCPVHVV